MPLNTQITDAIVNAQAQIISNLCDGGLIRIYDGVQPSSADATITTQILGVTLTMGSPAFSAPVSGVLTANAITQGVAVDSITPTWARIFKSDGTTVVADVSVGESDANMLLGAFTSGTTITCSSFTFEVKNNTTGL